MARELREIRVQGSTTAENVRTETFLGREYVVFDTVMLVEGVLQGANAATPEFVPADQFSKAPQGWNGRPAVMNHPQINGVYVSANDPKVLEEWAFGYVFNTSVDGKRLVSEVWLDKGRAEELGGEFQSTVDRLLAGQQVEVSTGLFTDVVKKTGKFNNRSYQGVWDGITPDHLALLSEGVLGACSIADGCGANRVNAENPGQIAVNTAALRTIDVHECDCGGTCGGCDGTEEEPAVAEKNVLEKARDAFQSGLDLVTQALKPSEDGPVRQPTDEELAALNVQSALAVQAIEGDATFDDIRTAATQALRTRTGRRYVWILAINANVVVYQADTDSYCCGGSYDTTYQLAYSVDAEGNITFTGEPEPVRLMTKIVKAENPAAGISANEGQEGATQGDEPMAGDPTANTEAGTGTPAAGSETQGQQTAAPVTPEAPAVQAAPKVQTTEEFLASAPPAIRDHLQRALASTEARKTQLVDQLKANKSNKFTEDQLKGFDIEVLEGMVALSGGQSTPIDYSGQGGFGSGVHAQSQAPQEAAPSTIKPPNVFEGRVQSRFNPNVSHDLGNGRKEGETAH